MKQLDRRIVNFVFGLRGQGLFILAMIGLIVFLIVKVFPEQNSRAQLKDSLQIEIMKHQLDSLTNK